MVKTAATPQPIHNSGSVEPFSIAASLQNPGHDLVKDMANTTVVLVGKFPPEVSQQFQAKQFQDNSNLQVHHISRSVALLTQPLQPIISTPQLIISTPQRYTTTMRKHCDIFRRNYHCPAMVLRLT